MREAADMTVRFNTALHFLHDQVATLGRSEATRRCAAAGVDLLASNRIHPMKVGDRTRAMEAAMDALLAC